MPIYYPDILSEASERRAFSYSKREAILYALGIGMGEDDAALSYVYEKSLQVVPTAITVLGGSIMPKLDVPAGMRKSSYDFPKVVHGEQKIVLHRPLLAEDTLYTETRTMSVADKGEGRGAVVVTETRWTDEQGGDVASLVNTIMARGDGGFGGPRSDAAAGSADEDREPDDSVVVNTRPDQALIYRLNGDMNPLHADPDVARQVGFDRPILHGLCTFGITCRAVLQSVANYDARRIYSHEGRFSAPVYPGEQIRVDLWQNGKEVNFRARSLDRGIDVIRNGKTILRDVG